MSSPNQNMERPENAPVVVPEIPAEDNVPLQSPEVQVMEAVNANVPLQSPEVQVMEPVNANVPLQSPEVQVVEPVNANVPLQSPEVQVMELVDANVQGGPELQAMVPVDANVQGGAEVQANANLPVQQPPEIQVARPADDNVPGARVPALCEAQNESSSGSSEGIFEEFLPHMVKMNLSLTPSSPATSSKLGSPHTPTLSTDMEERSSLTGTPSSEGSVEVYEATALTSEQMITEIVSRLPDSNKESTQKEGSAGDAEEKEAIDIWRLRAALSEKQRLPPLQKPAALPVVKSPIPQQRATSLPPLPGTVVTTPAPQTMSSVAILPPVTGATGGHQPSRKSRGLTKESSDSSLTTSTSESVQSESDSPKKQTCSVLPPVAGGHQPTEKSRHLTKESSDSSLSTSTSESVQSDSPKGPTHSAVDVVKRRDSSDGSKADESSMSGDSPDKHKKKTLYKKVTKSSTWTNPTPRVIRDMPPLSRADTLDDVETIRTDSSSLHSNPGVFVRPLSPERDRRAISLPADPPKKDPVPERRAYSEAKARDMEIVPAPPPQSLDTSVSWQSSDSVDLPAGVRSEPVKRVTTEKVTPTLRAISEGNSPLPPEDQPSSVYSPRVPEIVMEDDLCSEVVAYAGDLSASNSDLDPRRERPRRADREADRQMREFDDAVAEAQRVSSGRGTESDPPLSTLDSSSENRLAPVMAGYAGWLGPRDDEGGQSVSSSKSDSSSNQDLQMLQGWFGSGSQDQSGAGPSGVGKDTLSVISEKGESLSPSSVSGSMSPAEMEGVEDLPKPHGGDDRLETMKSEDVEMVEPEKDPKSRLVVNLKDDGSPRTPKRKREPKKSDDSPVKDPELLSPGEDSKKKYCSEFNRPVMAGQIARSSSTGSVKPGQVQDVDIEGFKKLAEKRRKSSSPDAEESARDPKNKSKDKDPEGKQEPPSA